MQNLIHLTHCAGDAACAAPGASSRLSAGEETRQFFCQDNATDTRVALSLCGDVRRIEARECTVPECVVKEGVESFVAAVEWGACSGECTDTLTGFVPTQSRRATFAVPLRMPSADLCLLV